MDAMRAKRLAAAPGCAAPERRLPQVTAAERDFWRRAVAAERARERSARPAPFPFQPA